MREQTETEKDQLDLAEAGEAQPASQANGADRNAMECEEMVQSDETEYAESGTPTQEQYDDLNDRYVRALAEVANVRRIAQRDIEDATRFGATQMVRDILTIHDHLQRALTSVDDQQRESASAFVEGIELTLRELLNALKRHGVSSIAPEAGVRFDPKLHQAMYEAPSPEIEAGCITQVMAEGFTIYGRLLRAAQVGVSSGPPVDMSNIEVEIKKSKP